MRCSSEWRNNGSIDSGIIPAVATKSMQSLLQSLLLGSHPQVSHHKVSSNATKRIMIPEKDLQIIVWQNAHRSIYSQPVLHSLVNFLPSNSKSLKFWISPAKETQVLRDYSVFNPSWKLNCGKVMWWHEQIINCEACIGNTVFSLSSFMVCCYFTP